MCNVNPYYNESFVFIVEQEMLRVRILHRNKRFLPQKLPHLVLIYDTTRVLPLRSRYVDTWTSISKIRTAKAEFLGSFRALDILLPQNSALAVLILEIDVRVSTYLLLSGRTLVRFSPKLIGLMATSYRCPTCRSSNCIALTTISVVRVTNISLCVNGSCPDELGQQKIKWINTSDLSRKTFASFLVTIYYV